MPSMERCDVDLKQLMEVVRSADNILVVSHQRPDGDCLGSTAGFLLGLRSLGKRVAAYNAGPIGEKWAFLPQIEEIAQSLPEWTPEWTFFVDCGAVYRVSDEFQALGRTVNIDHHLTNDRFGDFNWIDVDACAVGEQVYRLLTGLGVEITTEIASALYLSILTDTGGFRYSNTTASTFAIAGELVARGAMPGEISQAVFESRSPEEFGLIGRVLANLVYELDGKFVHGELRQTDFADYGGGEHEPEGLSSDIRGVRGVEISCLMQETDDGLLRAGFRGKGTVNCGAIAQRLGGGGHFNASGALLKGRTYEAARDEVLAAVRAEVLATFG